MMHDFHVGQKVVCVSKGDGPEARNNETLPVVGRVYSIRELYLWNGKLGLRFVEIVNAPRMYIGGVVECAFHSHNFRPLEEKPDAIEVFRQIARDVTAGKVRKLVGV